MHALTSGLCAEAPDRFIFLASWRVAAVGDVDEIVAVTSFAHRQEWVGRTV